MNPSALIRFTPLALSIFALSATAAPESEISEHIATVIQAERLKTVDPKFPSSSARKRQEGWVKISFVVTEEGDVVDPIVQDSSGLPAFERAALSAVKKWKYSPAMQDGKPIQQCKNWVQMDFMLEGKSGVTRRFMTRYRKVTKAIDANDLATAEEILSDMADAQLWNHTESAFYWLADSYYAKAISDPQRELKSVRRALSIRHDTVRENVGKYLLQREFVLSVELSEYNKALEAFDALGEMVDDDDDSLAQLSPYAEQVRTLVTGTEPMVRKASLDDDGRLYHELSRNAFELAITEGELEEVQIRCDNKLSRFTAVSKSEWRIPNSWGQCSVFVSGEPGAQFEVVEVGEYVGKS